MNHQSNQGPALTRRNFIKNTSILAASAAAMASFPGMARAQESKKLNAIIIGFGGRGGGAGRNFLDACKIAGVQGKIMAVADIFPDTANRAQDAYGVPADKCFSGFDGYMKALAVPDVNYAILATPPGFRPVHFKACIDAGKHVFTEKPVSVDGPGCQIMYKAGELAKQKGLKVAAGTQRRHAADYLETIKRIQDGEIGDVTSLRAYWVNGGPIWHRGNRGSTTLERQIANWYHYIWLCGDHIVEQHVHNIDVCNWIMGNQHPTKAWGMGARQQLGEKSGEIWDNFAVEYEYENGVRMASYCGQIKRDFSSVSEAVTGTKGTSNCKNMIRPAGGSMWRFRGQVVDPYMQEHVNLINAIVKDTELNETKTVTDSTLAGILGREAAYSGKQIDWDTMANSTFTYGPEKLYTDLPSMTWGEFRTLRPPVPNEHNIFGSPAMVPVAKA